MPPRSVTANTARTSTTWIWSPVPTTSTTTRCDGPMRPSRMRWIPTAFSLRVKAASGRSAIEISAHEPDEADHCCDAAGTCVHDGHHGYRRGHHRWQVLVHAAL